MKSILFVFVLFVASFADNTNNSIDLGSITLCATFNNVYRTFTNIWEIYNEFKATGQLWVPVATSACPVTPIDCTTLSPICAVSHNNFYKTFPNQCVLEAEQRATGTTWNIVFNGICSTNPGDGFATSKNTLHGSQDLNNAQNSQYDGSTEPSSSNSVQLSISNSAQSLQAISPLLPPASANYKPPQASQQSDQNVGHMPTSSLALSGQYNSPHRPFPYKNQDVSISNDVPQPPISGRYDLVPESPILLNNPPLSPISSSYDQISAQVQPGQSSSSIKQPQSSAQAQNHMYNSAQSSRPLLIYPTHTPIPAKYNEVSVQSQPERSPLRQNAVPSSAPANYDTDSRQSQPQQAPLASPLSSSGYYNSAKELQQPPSYSIPSSVPAKYDQVSAQTQPDQAQLPKSDFISYDIAPPSVRANYNQDSLQSPLQQAPSPSYASSSKECSSGSNNAASSSDSGYNDLVEKPKAAPTYSEPTIGNTDQGHQQSQYDIKSSSGSKNSAQVTQRSPTTPAYSLLSAHYDPKISSDQVKSPSRASSAHSAVLKTELERYSSVQEPQTYQKSPELSAIPANYGKVPAQGPFQSSNDVKSLPVPRQYSLEESAPPVQLKSSLYAPSPKAPGPPFEEQPSTKYSLQSASPANHDPVPPQVPLPPNSSITQDGTSIPGAVDYNLVWQTRPPTFFSARRPIPNNYGQAALQAQDEQVKLPTASLAASETYNLVQESQPLPQHSVPSPSSDNYNKGSVQAPVRSYASSAADPGHFSSVQVSQPSSTYSVPSPILAYYDKISVQTQRKHVSSQSFSPPLTSSGSYNTVQKEQPLPNYPENNENADQVHSEQSLVSSLSVRGNYDSVKEPQPSPSYSVASPIPANGYESSAQSQSKLAEIPLYPPPPESQPLPAYPAPSLDQQNYPEQDTLPSCSSSSVDVAQSPASGQINQDLAKQPESYSHLATLDNVNQAQAQPLPSVENISYDHNQQIKQGYQQSSDAYSAPSERSSESNLPSKEYYKNNEQSAPNTASSSNAQTYSEPQIASDVSVTSGTPNDSYNENSDLSLLSQKSDSDEARVYNDAGSTSQNTPDEAQTVYNGVVYQGPYYYEPKYKHINFGNFNFLPAQSPALPSLPSAEPASAATNPRTSVPEAQYQGYNTNAFEELFKQLQYLVAKNDKSGY